MVHDEGTDEDSRTDSPLAVAASRKKFETVFEHANDAIFIVDIENDSIVDCNPAAVDLVEYSREELLSMPASDLHPHNLPKFMDFANDVLEQGTGWTDDITCYCKSGDIIPAEMSASVVELDGRPHLVNHIRETSDREEREWFETLLEHSGDLITVVKHDGTIRYQSDSIDNILGYSPDELRDESYFEYVHPEDQEAVRNALETMVSRTGSVINRLEYRFRRADGSWAWIEAIVSYRPDSSITGLIINARDITPRKESQQQATVLNRILRHNLRNGLTVILGRARLLADTDPEARETHAETIVSSATNLQRLTSYTKDLSDMIGAHHVPQHRQNVSDLLGKAVNQLIETYPEAEFDLDVSRDPFVMATAKLDLAIEHVLTNAIEHNDADSPHVAITVRPPPTDDGYVEITVADNGPGIPKQEREVLLEGDEEPLKHGSGLGLWIVNWIITRSGGYIEFDANDPCGSRVTLNLPPEQ
jgi:PAS domain S-box-containing protein